MTYNKKTLKRKRKKNKNKLKKKSLKLEKYKNWVKGLSGKRKKTLKNKFNKNLNNLYFKFSGSPPLKSNKSFIFVYIKWINLIFLNLYFS